MIKTAKRHTRTIFFILAATQLLLSCGSKKNIASGETDNRLSAKNIIKNHYKNQLNFTTIRGRIKVNYDDGTSSKGFTMSFRMEKDKTIWMSAPLNMAKILITPDRVSFYSKLDNTYFDGNFSYLTELLGTALNFEKVQNLMLGQAIFDLQSESYKASVVNNTYRLKPAKDIALFKKLFAVEPANFKMALQQLSQPKEERILNINYKIYQTVNEKAFPQTIAILAEDGRRKTTIDLVYKNIELNQKVSFPYRIPKGYKEITAD